jgi:hypothetical protein
MYVEHVKKTVGNRKYEQILLRESYRAEGAHRSRVKHRTLLNLTHHSPEEIAALEWALKHKHEFADGDMSAAIKGLELFQGPSVGAIWLLYQLAEHEGIMKALGVSQEGRRTLWQVFARLIAQGSRLSAVRLAGEHAAVSILDLDPFDEDTLYRDMDWLDGRQARIEDSLYRRRHGVKPCQLFLYDVTSSYLEGEDNAYGDYGYNRDGKRGKKQIVVGMLADEDGAPLSVEVFRGNTQDPKTVSSQIRKLAERFGAHAVTLVGDRGMLKKLQLEELTQEGFHYLTAITKPQIETMLKSGLLQMDLFDESLCEVACEGVRYLMRRNPVRAVEISEQREDKWNSVLKRIQARNTYLTEHPKARVNTALKHVSQYAKSLHMDAWVSISNDGRVIHALRNETALAEVSRLDGCYVLKTDVASMDATGETLHARYKDLILVEQTFRASKTGHLELRPIYVRTAAHTRAHAFIVMLAYLLRRQLAKAWAGLDLTVEEGLQQLSTLCATEARFPDGAACMTVPTPRESVAALFNACGVTPPKALPKPHTQVATKKKLQSRRKLRIA